ncbi:uncharacterized protein LOC126907778 [Daktulosphaira vitifoliae]|uniref:uncharacterized protein LOC126907778 n=1 Tax=Daktulosphaira vitifoliae TaxID=58002 RepID=UPI0021A97DA3|nr:uncharacterized protein LOC126907778 [Daktulosphaira vitifoliae]
MNFYIFFVMYLVNSFTNGLLYLKPLTEENGTLNQDGYLNMAALFDTKRNHEKGMSYQIFFDLLKQYQYAHTLSDDEIDKLFTDVVFNKDGYMTQDQFFIQMGKCLKVVELNVKELYDYCFNKKEGMTQEQLIFAFKICSIKMDYVEATQLMRDFTRRNAQNINFEEFRSIFAHKLHKLV